LLLATSSGLVLLRLLAYFSTGFDRLTKPEPEPAALQFGGFRLFPSTVCGLSGLPWRLAPAQPIRDSLSLGVTTFFAFHQRFVQFLVHEYVKTAAFLCTKPQCYII
jgi:hypothetical protein